MNRFLGFLLLAGLMLSVWWLQSLAYDYLVAWISRDYVPQAIAYAKSNLDLGIFLSCLFAASCVLPFGKPLIAWPRIFWLVAAMVVCTGLITLLGGAVSLLAYRWGFLESSSWALAFPARHITYWGASLTFDLVCWLAILTLSMLVLNMRYSMSQNLR